MTSNNIVDRPTKVCEYIDDTGGMIKTHIIQAICDLCYPKNTSTCLRIAVGPNDEIGTYESVMDMIINGESTFEHEMYLCQKCLIKKFTFYETKRLERLNPPTLNKTDI